MLAGWLAGWQAGWETGWLDRWMDGWRQADHGRQFFIILEASGRRDVHFTIVKCNIANNGVVFLLIFVEAQHR